MTTDHESVLHKQLCLSLNRHWSVIGVVTVKHAITTLCSEEGGKHPALAMDIQMTVDENGNEVMLSAIPTVWEDWIKLPVRPGDLYVQTHKGQVRAPTVIVAVNYDKTPMRKPRLCRQSVLERDGYTCQYTGRKLPKSALNVDHVRPLDRGGKDEWTNMVACEKGLNGWKSNRLNSEVGLTLIRQPKAPPALPVAATIQEAKHPTWTPFLLK